MRAAAAALGLLFAAAAVWGQPVQQKRRELGQIQKELEKTRREISEFQKQQTSLSQQLRKLETHDLEGRRKIETIQRNIRQAEEKKSELKTRIGALQLASGFWKTTLSNELRDYQASAAARDDAFGTRALWGESFRRAAIAEKTTVLASLQGFSRKTEQAQAEVQRRSLELAGRSRKAKAEAQDSQERLEQTKAAFAENHVKVAAHERRAKELEESALALTQLLDRIGKAGRYKKTGPVGGLEVPRYSLPWPVEGTVARPFGREHNAELNTWVIRQGVLFRTGAAAPVAAVGAGKIIYSGPFRSYGHVVILDHGSSFFSIYGELGKAFKEKGASVGAGEVIARSGDGGKLYLELRRGTEALDPMVWLKRR
ncbi:MAG: peptidoglycan DD-metalloendopeptidase family protein [Elusimicrobiota bacterium]